jgi:opacity protein-like surface antigen
MKKTILACACALLLSTGSVFAQAQPAPGASSEGNVGPGATKSTTTKHTNMKKGTTTGTSTGKMKAGSASSMDNAAPGAKK